MNVCERCLSLNSSERREENRQLRLELLHRKKFLREWGYRTLKEPEGVSLILNACKLCRSLEVARLRGDSYMERYIMNSLGCEVDPFDELEAQLKW